MAPPNTASDQEKWVDDWFSRWKRGEKAKQAWEDQYQPGRCKAYWKGNQLEEPLDDNDEARMQINKIHPRVRASLPSIFFSDPLARVEMSPALADTPGQTPGMSIDDKQALLQNTANTFIRDESTNIVDTSYLCLKESYWSFGCARVMHDAMPVQNPNIPAPELKEEEDTPTMKKGSEGILGSLRTFLGGLGGPQSGSSEPQKRIGEILGMSEDSPLIKEERFYVKRIPARQVVWSADETSVIGEISWVGYWSVHYLEDIKEAGRRGLYENTEDLQGSGVKTGEDPETDAGGDESSPKSGKIKLYHIWDQRAKKYIVLADGHKKRLLYQTFKRNPLKFLRRDIDPDCFAPIPPIYHQLMPQDEVNDSREWLRLNRKGTVPRFTVDEDAIEPKIMKKLEKGKMGTYIPRKANTHNAIESVQHPNYSQVAAQTYALASEEFNESSMQGDEQRGVPRSKTATQAKIVEVRSQVQESYDRRLMARFIGEIVQEMLLMAIDRMSLPRWIQINSDPNAAGYAEDAAKIAQMYQQITHDQLVEANTGTSWRVIIETESMSPVAEQEAKEEWMGSLQLLGNPAMAALLSFSPELRRITLGHMGIKTARQQELIGEALQVIVQMNMAAATAGGPKPLGMASPPASTGGPQAPPQPNMPPGGAPPPPGPPVNTRQTTPGGGMIRMPM